MRTAAASALKMKQQNNISNAKSQEPTHHHPMSTTPLFRGKLTIVKEVHSDETDPHNTVTEQVYGFTDIELLSNNTWTPLSQDSDKFLVTAPSYAEAKDEFWSRWSVYLSLRFGIRFAKIIPA